jgi:hypothetical protein
MAGYPSNTIQDLSIKFFDFAALGLADAWTDSDPVVQDPSVSRHGARSLADVFGRAQSFI